jgi:CubicO group peptidase (beta-lactamase class C family)
MVKIALFASVLAVLILQTDQAGAQGFAWSEDDAAALSDSVLSGRYGQVTSLWIEQNDKLVYEHYFQDTTPETRHNMRSVGKTVTGMLLGLAIDKGFIASANSLVAPFFDDLRPFDHDDPRKEAMTLEDLLTMSGPLECDDWNSFSRGNEERMYLVEDWSAFFLNLPIKNRPSWEIPDSDGGFGRLFSYCTAGAQLLGEVVERASEEAAADFAARYLFGPLGITNPKWNYASSGKAHLGGGLELTTSEWARLARLYVNQGRLGARQIISTAWIDRSFSDYVQIDEQTNYGYFWWRPRYEIGGETFAANVMNGSGGNRVYALPEFKMVIVISKSDFRDRDAHTKSDQLFKLEIVPRLRE